MNKRINFLKNPRFSENSHIITFRESLNKAEFTVKSNDPGCPIRADPMEIIFRDFVVGDCYECTLKITNVSRVMRRIKYYPPSLLLNSFFI